MKRQLSPLLCLMLLLSGCTRSPIEYTASSRSSEASHSTEATQNTAPQSTEPEATQPQNTDPRDMSGSVTAGGIRVHTDLSGYRPYAPISTRYTRLREGALEDFTPSEDYGAVYPYAASRLFASSENGWSWEAGQSYGMVDAQGCILTDGIYRSVYLDSVYREEDQKRYSFWIVTKFTDQTISSEDGGWDYDQNASGVISLDGSFALPCQWASVALTEGGLVCRQSANGTSVFTVMDFEGNMLFRSEDVCGEVGENAYISVDYAEGLFQVELCRYDEEEPNNSFWFVNADGEIVLGPYQKASLFSEGLACVSTDGEHTGYIDKTGEWVIPPEYFWVASFEDGLAIQQDAEENEVVLNRSGAQILSMPYNTGLYRAPCGFETGSSPLFDQYAFYDREGKCLWNITKEVSDYIAKAEASSEDTAEDLNWSEQIAVSGICLDPDTFVRESQSQLTIFRLNEQAELHLDGEYSFQCGKMALDGELRDGYFGMDYNSDKAIFVPQDLSAAIELDFPEPKQTNNWYYDRYDQYQLYTGIQDDVTGDTWFFHWNGSAWSGMNERGETATMPENGRIYGDRVLVTQANACVYNDLQGNLIFSYPLDAED